MTSTECKSVICNYYCKRGLNGGDHCKTCWLNPAHKNNFEFSNDAKTLIAWGVQSEGFDFLQKFVNEIRVEMDALFVAGQKK